MQALDTIGQIVAADYRAAAVFERFGLDFCCGGKRTLGEACQEGAVDEAAVRHALDELSGTAGAGDAPSSEWPIPVLIDRIVSVHHAYVRSMLPVLLAHTEKIARVHGDRRPELHTVHRHFSAVAADLRQHMLKEEQILFPYLLSLAEAAERGQATEPSPFGTVENPIRMLEEEHQDAGYEMRLIRELTRDYVPPDFACTTYRACLAELKEFEEDLHRHVHLENNILFPAAVRLESQLA
jgi:regulator of cell morphogenesis and NO signaling